MNYFYAADKNRSNTLSKGECRDLLTDSLNVKVPDHIFEQMFRVNINLSKHFSYYYLFIGSRYKSWRPVRC